MAQRSDTGDLRRAGNTQKEQQAGHFEKEVLPVFYRIGNFVSIRIKRSARMRTRCKGRWLPKQPHFGARMRQGTFYFIVEETSFPYDKTLRADRTAAEWKNVACATRRRRRILLRRIPFYHCLRYSPGEIPSTFLNMREK